MNFPPFFLLRVAADHHPSQITFQVKGFSRHFLFASCCGRSPSLANHISKCKDSRVIFFLLRVAADHRPSQITFPSERILASFSFCFVLRTITVPLKSHFQVQGFSRHLLLLRVADNHRPSQITFPGMRSLQSIFCFVLRTITVPWIHTLRGRPFFASCCGQSPSLVITLSKTLTIFFLCGADNSRNNRFA